MLRKFSCTFVLTLTFLALDWANIVNSKFTGMKAIASPCTKIGEIIEIKDGFVEKKRPGGSWQKITKKTALCDGDILKATSNPKQKVTAIVQCIDSNQTKQRIAPDEVTGVGNICFRVLQNTPRGIGEAIHVNPVELLPGTGYQF